ncbi:MAG: hypothetical protein JWP80_2251 [Pseudomonas sp.]|nr:hypothetical protein [Pseudomonas sp.]
MQDKDLVIYASAGNLIVFPSLMSAQLRQDILYSNLFGQLAATHTFSAFTMSKQWYRFYTNTLAKVWWISSGMGDRTLSADELPAFTVINAIMAPMPIQVSTEKAKEFAQIVSAVGQLPRSTAAIELLHKSVVRVELVDSEVAEEDHQQTTINHIRLQISFAVSDQSLIVFCLSFSTTEAVAANMYGQAFALDQIIGDIEINYFSAKLDDAYATDRSLIISKLGNKVETMVIELPALQTSWASLHAGVGTEHTVSIQHVRL